MNQKNINLAEKIVKGSYIRLGQNSLSNRQGKMRQILSQRQLPQQGFDDLTIRYFLNTLALMDSNNFDQKTGVGQRQSRIFSNIVLQRHFYMGHGIGRSGDIMANQPKAAGSSLLLQITRFLTVSALKQLHYEFVNDVLLLPLATGMSLSLSFLTLSQLQPNKKWVIWSRIDQKTCLKSIITANLKPVVIELQQLDDSLVFNPDLIEQKIKQLGPENILCIVSTTSCFAPRVPDDVARNSQIAHKYKIFHVVNNAYGLWCSKIAHKIKEGFKKGQCTIVVQSTDKNFMVPVGGSIIFCQSQKILQKISSKYPGRANASPIVDMFITLLSMGKKTIQHLQNQRKENYKYLKEKAKQFAQKYNQRILETPSNTISIAMKLAKFNFTDPTNLGSILYSKRVMGHRIVNYDNKQTNIGGIKFINYGSHSNNYPFLPYITFACSLGTTKEEIDCFISRLEKSITEMKKKQSKYLKGIKIQMESQNTFSQIKSQVKQIGYDCKEEQNEEITIVIEKEQQQIN